MDLILAPKDLTPRDHKRETLLGAPMEDGAATQLTDTDRHPLRKTIPIEDNPLKGQPYPSLTALLPAITDPIKPQTKRTMTASRAMIILHGVSTPLMRTPSLRWVPKHSMNIMGDQD